MRKAPVYVLIIILALVVTGAGMATAIVVNGHGYLLDQDGRAHVQMLTGLDYGAPLTPSPHSTPQKKVPQPSPTATPSPVTKRSPTITGHVTIKEIIDMAFCPVMQPTCALSKQAEKVAMCMSKDMPTLTNVAGGMGLFGLRASTWAMSPEASQSPFDPAANAKAAAWLYHTSGNSWYRWGMCATDANTV